MMRKDRIFIMKDMVSVEDATAKGAEGILVKFD